MSRVAPIGMTPVAPAVSRDQRSSQPSNVGQATDTSAQEQGGSQGPDIQAEVVEMQDEMGDVMAQFAQRLARLGRRNNTRRSEERERILDSDADEKLDELHEWIRVSSPGGRELLDDARRRFDDVSDLMLALRELRRRRRLEGEPVDALEEAIDELVRQADSKVMKAGINAALKAKVFGSRMNLAPARLRQLYRQFLLFEGTYLMVYESWIEEFGLRRRKRILEYVQAALTYDMHSLDPSCSGADEFGPLLCMLGRMRTLSSADEQFIGRLLDARLSEDSNETEALGMTMLLSVLQRPELVPTTLEELMTPYLLPRAARERSELMQCVLRAAASIPVSIFEESEHRHALIDTVKEMAGVLYEPERRARRPRRHPPEAAPARTGGPKGPRE